MQMFLQHIQHVRFHAIRRQHFPTNTEVSLLHQHQYLWVQQADIFCIAFYAFRFIHSFSVWTSIIAFTLNSFIISIFPLVTTEKFIHHCRGCQ